MTKGWQTRKVHKHWVYKNTIVALLLVTNANGSKKRQFLGRASFGEDSQTS
jgi:hypothetical protein